MSNETTQKLTPERMNRIRSELRDYSNNGACRGMLLSDFQKRNHLRSREVITFIEYHFTAVTEQNDGKEYNSCQLIAYRLTESGEKKDRSIPFDDLIEDIDYIDVIDEFNGIDRLDSTLKNTYIILEDSLQHAFRRKFEEEFDLIRISSSLEDRKGLRELWDTISNRELPPIINKNAKGINPLEQNKTEQGWIEAIIKQYPVKLTIRDQEEFRQDIIPLGLYSEPFLEQDFIVYQKEKELLQIPLASVRTIEKTGEVPAERQPFSIDQYLKEKRTETIRLRVYHKEANVGQKLLTAIGEENLTIIGGDEYDIYEWKVVNASDYEEKLLGYGKSVIVEAPEKLRQNIIRITKKALALYQDQ